MRHTFGLARGTALILLALAALAPVRARAHCDGLDGPVVKAARAALEKGDVNLVLVWVQKHDEPEVRAGFARTREVRSLGPQARELADTWFFETLVRLHRAGEGAPFTGLKPAGRDLGPAIPAADRALEGGDPEPLIRLLLGSVESEVREGFRRARDARGHRSDDVAAGRQYVETYVEFIHDVERLYQDATSHAHGHYPESEAIGLRPHDRPGRGPDRPGEPR